ncbi:lactonase family protein [Flavobacterium psychrotrophum]|uniref:lactonase family protein n=1 Tax=Flavobacterium psychrotrophum TaxID=2294119 RepID=UPI000E31D2EA|nr:lactonase family protein [Flavobacterium psychrotrophum]
MKLIKALALFAVMNAAAQDNYNLIIGTYTNACPSKGLYVYDFNTTTLDYKLKSNTDAVVNPSYLTVSNDKKFVYSVNEDGKNSTVSAFKYNTTTGKLDFVNKTDSKGADPCYIINDDKNVIVANYSGGTISVFEKKSDGSLSDAIQTIKHSGTGPDKGRQESAHVHMVYFSPDKKYVFANDLGTDKIFMYTYNPGAGAKTLTLKESFSVKAGSGPRHLVFNPNNTFVYLLQELDGTLTTFDYMNDKLTSIQEINVTPNLLNGKHGAADIHFSNDGKFLYATNRGDANTISAFRVHANGMLSMVQQISTQGSGPRNFTITPNDNFVLVANQNTNNVTIFKRDKSTGFLTDTGKKIELCQPVCLVFTGK